MSDIDTARVRDNKAVKTLCELLTAAEADWTKDEEEAIRSAIVQMRNYDTETKTEHRLTTDTMKSLLAIADAPTPYLDSNPPSYRIAAHRHVTFLETVELMREVVAFRSAQALFISDEDIESLCETRDELRVNAEFFDPGEGDDAADTIDRAIDVLRTPLPRQIENRWWIISGDNYDREGPQGDEALIAVVNSESSAKIMCDALNDQDVHSDRIYRVVPSMRKLRKFEP